MISGVHSIIYSSNAEADRAFFRDVLKLTNVDVGGGWLIFGLPPSEIAIHPSVDNSMHELYLMCEDIKAFVSSMSKHRIKCSAVKNQGWGLLSQITLPGGGKLGVYQPRHARPEVMEVAKVLKVSKVPKVGIAVKKKTSAGKPTKKAAKKKVAKKSAGKISEW